MISIAKWFSNMSISGLLLTASIRLSWISNPVLSAWWSMRNSECPPSRWRSKEPSSFLSKSTPHLISCRICSGAPVTTFFTASRSDSQSPATIVSCICLSKSSTSILVTDATPPCARAVFASSRVVLHISATFPFEATLRAKLMPAMPEPITKKSYFFVMAVTYGP